MKKRLFFLLTFLSVFLICSISVIPSAHRHIVKDEIKSNIEDNINDIDKLKELYYKIKTRTQSNNDCDCNSNVWRPNLICLIMNIIILPIFLLVFLVLEPLNLNKLNDLFWIPMWIWLDIYALLGCD